jgi:hypothetical protein
MVGIDFVGALPETANGNRYLLVAQDYLTKWPFARATKDARAITVAQFIYDEIICTHGCPEVIRSDGGRSFDNRVVACLADQFEIRHTVVAAYHPQANGLVERLNGTLKDSIHTYLGEHETTWDQYISGVLFSYRTTPQASTGFSPFYLVYGREARQPIDLEYPASILEREETISERVVTIINKLEVAREMAATNIAKAQARQKRNYDKRITPHQFEIGDKVLMDKTALRGRHDTAFSEHWEGPYHIHEVTDKGLYQIRTGPTTCLDKLISGDRLKLYKDRPSLPVVHIEQLSSPQEAATDTSPPKDNNNSQSTTLRRSPRHQK